MLRYIFGVAETSLFDLITLNRPAPAEIDVSQSSFTTKLFFVQTSESAHVNAEINTFILSTKQSLYDAYKHVL